MTLHLRSRPQVPPNQQGEEDLLSSDAGDEYGSDVSSEGADFMDAILAVDRLSLEQADEDVVMNERAGGSAR